MPANTMGSVCTPNEAKDVKQHVLEEPDNIIYYGVHVPSDIPIPVLTDKSEALTVVKNNKKARFKAFSTYDEAEDFAVNGSEFTVDNNLIAGVSSKQETAVTGEKPSQFRAPKPQDLVKLRKVIEVGDLESVRKTIWDNPRYLISIGDTPSILQEGPRYNSLHVATKAKNYEMCELILNTISNISFVKLLYIDDKNPKDRAKILLDLYLNTPDKGLNETPLHFAAKFGADKCVETLVSYPQCDKTLTNKFKKMPCEIICERYDGFDSLELSARIYTLLQDNYYVPVIRTEDNCAPPVIGEPFTPKNPPILNPDIKSPRVEIHAYAGPMTRSIAENFRKIWKTPPRNQKLISKNRFQNLDKTNGNEDIVHLKLKDPERGLERVGQNLATKMGCGWKEYWPFLDSFVDIASADGLEQLEQHLASLSTNILNISPPTSSETNSLLNSSLKRLKVKQIDGSSNRFSCYSFEVTDKNSNSKPHFNYNSNYTSPQRMDVISPISDLCRALESCTLNDSYHDDFGLKSELSPLYCIEKSLQVFARRIANDIVFQDCSFLQESQTRQLQSLMSSFMCDNRFANVDFSLVHSRLASLIHVQILQTKSGKPDAEGIVSLLDGWLDYCNKNSDSFSTDDESSSGTQIQTKNQHTICILKTLQDELIKNDPSTPVKDEEDCQNAWCKSIPCLCIWRNKLKKKSNSLRNNVAKKKLYSTDLRNEEHQKNDVIDHPRNDLFNIKNDIYEHNMNHVNADMDASSDEEYFTPPSSPLPEAIEHASDSEQFVESILPQTEVFIEGDVPTKIDNAVYNALQFGACQITPYDYPNIYRWKHAVSLYNEAERNMWLQPSIGRCTLGGSTSTQHHSPPKTPPNADQQQQWQIQAIATNTSTRPSAAWLRVTGANSPRASLTTHRTNVSFNL